MSLTHRSLNKVMGDILYAQCWEDPQIDRAAFNTGSDDVVFSITSGGCNVLTFLLDNPRRVIALDLNPRQNYLLELKMAAFKNLDYDDLLGFFGVSSSEKRSEQYAALRNELSDESQTYWDSQSDRGGRIDCGIIHCGRFEGYLKLLRKWLYRLVGRSVVEELCQTEDPEKRSELYRVYWENLRWRLFTGCLLSRAVMTLLFSRAFFTQLDDRFSFGVHFRGRVRHALTELPMQDNYFLSYMLTGGFRDKDHLPIYLRRENYETIRSRLHVVQMVNSDCSSFFRRLPDNSISRFNFSNIFEWMTPTDFESLLRESVRVGRDGAILTYRNLLVPRSSPISLADRIHPLKALAEALHERDLSFIYKAYVVEQIVKDKDYVISHS